MMAIFWCATVTAQNKTDWAITHVNVVPMDREVILEDRTVVIRDGRIAEIAPAEEISIPNTASAIDGTGKYLLPGLIDMHVHLHLWNRREYDPALLGLYLRRSVRELDTRRGGGGSRLRRSGLRATQARPSAGRDLPRPHRYVGEGGLADVRDMFDSDAEPPAMLEPIGEDILAFMKMLYDAGVPVFPGTDSRVAHVLPGFSFHDELDILLEAGLTPFETLHAATVTAAEVLGELDNVGTIELGKEANLVLADENPLDDLSTLRAPYGVMILGRWHDRARLESLFPQ